MKYLRIFLIVFFNIPSAITAFGQQNDTQAIWSKIVFSEKSEFVIHGQTSFNDFTCTYQGDIEDSDTILFLTKRDGNKYDYQNAVIDISVDKFDCANRIITRDFQELLQADTYPSIAIELNSLTIYEKPLKADQTGLGHFDISMTIAGVTNAKRVILLSGQNSNEEFNLAGILDLNIREFDLEPPTKLGGLIKVKEELSIELKLILSRID
jgi:hypothetical protein